MATTSNAKFIALTESHLSPDINDSEISLHGFTPFRSDREMRCGGGVITFVKATIACQEVISFSDKYCSINMVKLINEKLTIINIYRPPDCPVASFQEIIIRIKATILPLQSPMEDIILLGDFNLPRMRWPEGEVLTGGLLDEQRQGHLLLDLANTLMLSQYITKPTRGINTLDLVFTNNHELFLHYSVTPTIISDHNIIEISFNHPDTPTSQCNTQNQTQAPLSKLDFSKADWDHLNKLFQETNWTEMLQFTEPSQSYEFILLKIENICQSVIPERKPKSARKIPRQCRIWFRNKANLCKQLKLTTSQHRMCKLLDQIHSLEFKLQNYYNNNRKEMEKKALKEIKSNSKVFFKYAKKFSKTKVGIGPFLDENDKAVHSPSILAEMLSSQYKKVFITPRSDKEILDPANFFSNTDRNNPSLSNFEFDLSDVEKVIDLLKVDSAPGPDGLPTVLLKKCKSTLSQPLTVLWRQSLDTGKIPDPLKYATIIPIHKGDSRAIPKNYRPVALTSHLIKVFERLMRNNLVSYLEKHDFMNEHQHGFRPGRSCLTQLIEHYDLILHYLENGVNVDVIYLDFAKAFDKVDHGILCHKLLSMGISGKIGAWLHNFLHNRLQRVLVNGSLSSPTTVISGVPQGTVLGPILFLIHIADIDNGTTSHVSSFADDTRVLRPIKECRDVVALQSDLETIYTWQEANNMEFNSSKFETLRYGKNLQIKRDTGYKTPSGTPIEVKNSVRDLGITMSSDCSFKTHIVNLCAKVRSLTGWILRTFIARDKETMKVLWSSLVRPHLDYCSQLYAPQKIGEMTLLENLQRSFTAQIDGMGSLDYWERLTALGWLSVERRFDRYRMIYTWKALEGVVPDFGVSCYNTHRNGRMCRVPSINTKASQHSQSLMEGSLRVCGPRLFNSIPAATRALTGCQLPTFKSALDDFLKTVPDQPRIPGYAGRCHRATNSMKHMAGAQL